MEGKVEPVKVAASDTISVGTDGASANTRISIPDSVSLDPSDGQYKFFPANDIRTPADPLGTHPVLIKDPLSEVTRRERKTFLGVSILAIAIVKANLIPNKVSAFGIEIDHVKHEALVTIVTAVVFYFLMVFVAYAYSDFLGWRIAFWEASRARVVERKKLQKMVDEGAEPDSPEVAECYKHQLAWSEKALPTSVLRALLDFLLPILVGIAAILVLKGCA